MTTLDLQRRFTLQAALASGLALQLAPHAFAQALPAPLSEMWTDAARARDVPVLLRWPMGKPLGG